MLESVSLDKLVEKQEEVELQEGTTPEEEIVVEDPTIENNPLDYQEQEESILSSVDDLEDIIEAKECLEETSEASEALVGSEEATEEELQNQFEVAQENLFISLGRVGYKKSDIKTLSLKLESGLSIREKLRYQTEGVKEGIIFVVQKILDAIEWLYRKIKKWLLIILADITGKKIATLNALAAKATIEDARIDFMKLCHDVYKEYEIQEGEIKTEDNDPLAKDITRAQTTSKTVHNVFKEFVKHHGYLLDTNDRAKAVKELLSFIKNKVNISTKNINNSEDLLNYLRKISTSIDKDLIVKAHKQNKEASEDIEPLIIYDHDLEKISYCYYDIKSKRIRKAMNVPHGINHSATIKKLTEDFLGQAGNKSDADKLLNEFRTVINLFNGEGDKLLKKTITLGDSLHNEALKYYKKNMHNDTMADELNDVGLSIKVIFQSVSYNAGQTIKEIYSYLRLFNIAYDLKD